MKLAGDVTERSGRVLLRAETEITEKHLSILKKWGVTEVDAIGTEDNPAEEVQPIGPSILREAELKAEALFRHTDRKHPAICELFRLCALRMARHELGARKHVT
jgi:hypothetical protein